MEDWVITFLIIAVSILSVIVGNHKKEISEEKEKRYGKEKEIESLDRTIIEKEKSLGQFKLELDNSRQRNDLIKGELKIVHDFTVSEHLYSNRFCYQLLYYSYTQNFTSLRSNKEAFDIFFKFLEDCPEVEGCFVPCENNNKGVAQWFEITEKGREYLKDDKNYFFLKLKTIGYVFIIRRNNCLLITEDEFESYK